jgi:Mrp family chromosome partitioning ATPase
VVERLRDAIEKARDRRKLVVTQGVHPPPSTTTTPADWSMLPERTLDAKHLREHRIVNFERQSVLSEPFDLLRTSLLKLDTGGKCQRIGVTSPTKGCGKTTICANLSFSLARHVSARALVLDLDLRAPMLGRVLGVEADISVADMLTGAAGYEASLLRIRERVAVGLNGHAVADAAEILQSKQTANTLSSIIDALSPTVALYDLPPMLVGDDALGFLDQLDGVLLVAAAGVTTAAQIEECERLLGENALTLWVVMNKCEDEARGSYSYEYG